MKTKLYIILSVIFVCILSNSCSDDFLIVKPLDRISDSDVWTDANLAELVVNNAHKTLYQYFVPSNDPQGVPGSFLCLSDEAYARAAPIFNLINEGNMTPSDMGQLNYWKSYYGTITQCNLFLTNIKDSEIDADRKNRMMGEMKFLRAYAYFMLVSFHGEVPLITEPFSLTDDFGVAKSPYNECMEFVVKEFDEAAGLLKPSYTGTEVGRLTTGAALALKARALLYIASPLNNPTNEKAKWQAASDAAKAVIDLNLYSLFPDYQTLFLAQNELNSEIIWQRRFRNQTAAEHYSDLIFWPNGDGGYCQVAPLHNLVDCYEMKASGKLPKDDPAYDPQDPYAGRDPRFYASISYNGAPWKSRQIQTFLPGGLDSSDGPTGWNASPTAYHVMKYVNEDRTPPPSSRNTGDTPWTYCRYAEVLLNYAEAQFYLGNEDVCREYLNMIRDRESVQMPHITESGAALEARMRNERKIELVFESHRYFDVRRWKIADQTENFEAQRMQVVKKTDGTIEYTPVNFQTRKFYERNYWVPIPQDEINKSKELLQNPAYN